VKPLAPAFSISIRWWPRETPRQHDESNFELWDNESRALFRFIAQQEGELTLHFGQFRLELDLDDLPMVFDKITAVTDSLHAEGNQSEIYFASQGTDLRLTLRRLDDAIAVSFHLGLTAPSEFTHLSDQTVTVDAESFIREWLDLRERVRAALAQLR
jgi:hypothetical protein